MADDWQPLETAPNETPVLVQYRKWNSENGRLAEQVAWRFGDEWRRYPATDDKAYADRWRPLPTAPDPIREEAIRNAAFEQAALLCGRMAILSEGTESDWHRARHDGLSCAAGGIRALSKLDGAGEGERAGHELPAKL